MEVIQHDNRIISIIYRDSDWVKGLNFITPDELFIQVGSWWYDKGKKLDAHVHKEFDRNSSRTQESILQPPILFREEAEILLCDIWIMSLRYTGCNPTWIVFIFGTHFVIEQNATPNKKAICLKANTINNLQQP